MKRTLFFVVLLLLSCIPIVVLAQDRDIPRANAETVEAWRAMRFGMFIHWGPVSLTGKEIGWSRASETTDRTTNYKEYDQLYKKFNPVQFDANAWVSIAKQAGMKYMVFTSKHHDGFTMWDSEYTDYDIMASPFHRDVIQELSDACKRQGLKFGPYYSICDWYNPDYGLSHNAQPGFELDREPDMNRHIQYIQNQLRELERKYGPFHVFWFDGEWEEPWTHEMGLELNAFCKELQPDALVNNRVDKGRQGMKGMSKSSEFAGDYGTPEQEVGNFNRDAPWETCMTIGRQWAWKPNDEIKSLKECLQTLIYTIGGDGNLLFNVGPMPDGRIEPRQVERLMDMGKWIGKHEEAIYGTRGGPFKPGEWGASTCKGNTIYLFVMNWDEGKVRLPALPVTIQSVRLFEEGSVAISYSGDRLIVQVPEDGRDPIATVIALELDGEALDIEPVSVEGDER